MISHVSIIIISDARNAKKETLVEFFLIYFNLINDINNNNDVNKIKFRNWSSYKQHYVQDEVNEFCSSIKCANKI